MATYSIEVPNQNDAVLRKIAASEGYADTTVFVRTKWAEVFANLVKDTDSKLRTSVWAAMSDPVKAEAIKVAAGL